MIKPTIHRNGTSREELLDQLTDAAQAGRQFVVALEDASPNGRDYYPQGDGAILTASTEWASRVDKVQAVISEMMELAEHVADSD